MFRKALLPIDGSERARAAAAQVVRLLDHDAGRVIVLEVIDSPHGILAHTTPAGFGLESGGIDYDTVREIVEGQRAAADRHVSEVRGLLEYGGIDRVETRVVEGSPGPTIVEVARAEGCDVLVMATHGRTGLGRTLLGSVAEHVVRHLTGIPVLLIHPEPLADAPATAREPTRERAPTPPGGS